MRYETAKDGEWIQPDRYGYRMMCCDCRLVHEFNFRIYRGRIQYRARRLPRATAAARRKRKGSAQRIRIAKPEKARASEGASK